jgi:hypothetical protein
VQLGDVFIFLDSKPVKPLADAREAIQASHCRGSSPSNA